MVESGAAFVRGPEVRTTTIRTLLSDAPKSTMQELHRFGGTVSDRDGQPVSGAWIAVPDLGRWAVSNNDGHFHFARLSAGSHRVLARTADGREAEATVSVPGGKCDLTIGSGQRRPASYRVSCPTGLSIRATAQRSVALKASLSATVT